MNKSEFRVVSNREIALNTYEMCLAGDVSAIERPGQFVNIAIDGLYLRRPISVCDVCENGLTVIFKVVGKGTALMAEMLPDKTLDLLVGLGNGYDLSKIPDGALLIGGGAGVPLMYYLAKRLVSMGKKPVAILGFNSAREVFYEDKFRETGIETRVAAADGSAGIKGFVTDAMFEDKPYVCACGPEPMLRAVYNRAGDGQFSFEERMGCGFGACMGCTCETLYSDKRICRDGPVLEMGEIKWPTRG